MDAREAAGGSFAAGSGQKGGSGGIRALNARRESSGRTVRGSSNYPLPCSTHPSRRRALPLESGRETSRSHDSTRRAPRTSSPAFPDDRRAHAPRPSDHGCFPVEPIRSPLHPSSLSTSREKETNLPAIGESGCSRRPTMREKTHRCDASGRRRLLTSLLFDLARELRAVVACALCVKPVEGANVQTEPGGPTAHRLHLLSHVSRTALVYKPKK